MVDEEARTVRWAEGVAAAGGDLARLRALEYRLFELLIAHDAWRTAGLSLSDSVTRTKRQRADLGAHGEEPPSNGAPRVMPAIPMGGMRPARKVDTGAGEDTAVAPEEAAAQAGDASGTQREPKAPDAPKPDGETRPESLPAIRMNTGGQPARKAMPMIPMGGAPVGAPGEDVAAQVRRRLTEQLRVQASQRCGALLATERDAEARGVADVLLGELNDARPRAALLSAAFRARSLRRAERVHQDWLDWTAR